MWPSLINVVKAEYNAIRIWPQRIPRADMEPARSSVAHSAYHDERQGNPRLKSPSFGRHRAHNLSISHRTSLGDTVTLQGWPSRGGVIVLENATPPDFDFLHLDALDPPLRCDPDQTTEDAFCQALLRLGATWWDSEARCNFINQLEAGEDAALDAVRADEDLEPTRRECGWVRVAWPSYQPGALCVLACEKLLMGRKGDEKLRPRHYGLISLARTMDERCTVLKRFGGTMYASIDEYQGPTFLKAWEENHKGERGSLVKKDFIDPSKYGGHPDDALFQFDISRSTT